MKPVKKPLTFRHARRIAGYNLPLYAAAGFTILVGLVVALLPDVPLVLRWLAALGAGAALWFAVVSFWAFHWMFDRSELLSGSWLLEEITRSPARWVQINAGLEETTLPLDALFPEAAGKMLDIFDPAAMTEPALNKARQERTANTGAPSVRADALPVEDGWGDLVVVMLAAHEIRDVETRARFFQELRRIVAVNGRVVLVEHLRDLAAALAFGPGLFHFAGRREWLQLGSQAGFEIERERRITPFICVFVYRRPSGIREEAES